MHAITIGAFVAAMLFGTADDCYLVTNERIERIQCDFRASVTDALRYAAADTPEARARRAQARQRTSAAVQPMVPYRSRAFARMRIRED